MPAGSTLASLTRSQIAFYLPLFRFFGTQTGNDQVELKRLDAVYNLGHHGIGLHLISESKRIIASWPAVIIVH